MTTLNRLVVAWSGPQIVGQAVTVLHFTASDNAAPNVAAIVGAFDRLTPMLPTGVTLTIPGSGDKIDDTTGELVGVWDAGAGGTKNATGAAKAAAGVGACVTWNTGGIVNGRRLKGRTFIVPMANDQYAADGTIENGTLGQINLFANDLKNAGALAVWHRPTSKDATDGNSYGVLSFRVRDKVAVLSSRRN
jgi:hypothetical protein